MSAARLLTPAGNYAVVHMEGRRFPGVVVQGDTLHNLIGLLEAALRDPAETPELISEVLGPLQAALTQYERVCADEGLGLPYPTGL